MNWRKWMYDNLLASPELLALVPEERIFGSGSVESVPTEKPFIVVQISDELPTIGDATQNTGTVWVHDEPGDYGIIGDALSLIRKAFPEVVHQPGGIACTWQGNSGDLANDTYNTITRNASFYLFGRDG